MPNKRSATDVVTAALLVWHDDVRISPDSCLSMENGRRRTQRRRNKTVKATAHDSTCVWTQRTMKRRNSEEIWPKLLTALSFCVERYDNAKTRYYKSYNHSKKLCLGRIGCLWPLSVWAAATEGKRNPKETRCPSRHHSFYGSWWTWCNAQILLSV